MKRLPEREGATDRVGEGLHIVNMLPEGEVESVVSIGLRGPSSIPDSGWPHVRYNISYGKQEEKPP